MSVFNWYIVYECSHDYMNVPYIHVFNHIIYLNTPNWWHNITPLNPSLNTCPQDGTGQCVNVNVSSMATTLDTNTSVTSLAGLAWVCV